MRRAQTVTLDLIAGAALFLLFVGIMLALLLNLPRYDDDRPEMEFEMMYVFENLEANLLAAYTDPFYQSYRIDATALDTFASSTDDIDPFFLEGSAGGSSGLGLVKDGYDVCMYLLDVEQPDGTQPFITMGSDQMLGDLDYADATYDTCREAYENDASPCEGYRQAMSVFRPVLYDTGNYDDNRVVQMNVVACKK